MAEEPDVHVADIGETSNESLTDTTQNLSKFYCI